jgi:hypothetical protein
MTNADYAPVNGSGPEIDQEADPTAEWPIPYSLTHVAEALLDAEAGS